VIYQISPNYTSEDFPQTWTLENKIEIFIDRIQGYQLHLAREIISRGIPHRGPGLLNILMSHFEMIGKYKDGYTKNNRSKYYFKIGMRDVFPDIEPEMDAFLDDMYKRVRCGIYHMGAPKEVIIGENEMGSIGYNAINEMIWINPDILLNDIELNFANYANALRDTSNLELRKNFEKRFDHDNP
jgi:hypothetical protein